MTNAILTNGLQTAEVTVLRLRQAFWLFAVVRCAARSAPIFFS
jgi:hypothetical protein